jgi:hypothetical protein
MEKIDKKPLGAIDALFAGFELVFRQPWILLVPIALDLFLWLGPQIHAKPIFDQLLSILNASAAQSGSPDTQQALDAFKSAFQAAGEQFNVFSFVAMFGMGIPTIMPIVDPPPVDLFKPAVLFSIEDQSVFLGWFVLFALVGVLLGSIYLAGIARAVKREPGNMLSFLPETVRSFARVLMLVVALGLGGLVLMIPFALGALLVSLLSPGLGVFFILAIWLVLMWAALYLSFAVPSIFVSGVGVQKSILNSITVFRYNFWSAIGLVFLVVVIQMGFSIIWQQFQDSTAGLIVDMLANAVLGTALVAAMMLFYYDRFTWLTAVRERIREQHRPSIKG